MSRKQKTVLARIIISAVLCVVAGLLPIDGVWKLLAFSVPYLVIGYDVLWGAVRNIIHGQVFDEQFLMAIATLGAFAIEDYPEAAAVMLFYQVGELFQSIAVGKSRKSISALMDICPEYAVVLRDGEEVTVPPEEVGIGEVLIIKPGEKIPLDGEITEGSTTVNTAALTGESLPVDKTVGDRVISGTINLSGVIKVKAQSLYEESTVSKILELVENSAEKKARAENFITRFARYYTPCVVIGAVLLAVIPPLFFSQEWSMWINRALIFLVVSCPCALVVSVPLSFFGGIGGASREGILIKGANYLETLSKVDTVVFDKTGTLTKGTFAVNAIHPQNMTEAQLLDIAAAAESYSTHPVGESIVAAHKGHIDKTRIGEVEEIAGMGLRAVIDGKTFFVGNGALMDKVGAGWHDCHLAGTVIHIAERLLLGDGDSLCIGIKLSFAVGEAVYAGDYHSRILAQTVEYNSQGLGSDLVCVESDFDSALSGGEALVTRKEAEALRLFREEHLAEVAVTETDLAVFGDGAGDAERLKSDTDCGRCVSGLDSAALDSDGAADSVCPNCVFEADGLCASDDFVAVNALCKGDILALLNGGNAVLGENRIYLIYSSFIVFK